MRNAHTFNRSASLHVWIINSIMTYESITIRSEWRGQRIRFLGGASLSSHLSQGALFVTTFNWILGQLKLNGYTGLLTGEMQDIILKYIDLNAIYI